MESISLSVGEKIGIFRRRAGYSRGQLAKMAGVSPQTIANYENGLTLPDLSILEKLATVFDINFDLLLFNPEEEERRSYGKVRLTQSQLQKMF